MLRRIPQETMCGVGTPRAIPRPANARRGTNRGDVPDRVASARSACVATFLAGSAVLVSAAGEGHELSQQAVEIARPFGFPVTNSMVVSWIVAVLVVLFARLATRTM